MAANAAPPTRGLVAPWRRRGIDPHLWGFQLLGMGILLELLLLLLGDPGWTRLGTAARGITILAAVWIAAGGGLAVAALFPRTRRRRSALIPPPGSRILSWPPGYRIFLAAGFVFLLVLALFVLTTP